MLHQSCLASTVKGGPLLLRSSLKREMKMASFAVFTSVLFAALIQISQASPLRLQKRAAFYIANETACVVDNLVYLNGDPIPTDDPCEACKCRPPGFACVLKDCPKKPGCRAVRRTGECCPEYVCGCEHNGRMYRDGDEIRDSKNPCYTCHCQGSSIACAFVDCFFRVDCAPEYVQDKCCPEYNHCATALDSNNASTPHTTISIENSVYDITTTLPQTQESKVEYVEPEDSKSNENSEEETVEARAQALPPQTLALDVAEVIHRIAITVEDEQNMETTPKSQTTEDEATTEYETTKDETTIKSETTASQSTEDFVTEEISSPVTEINDEINLEKQLENETNLLKTELDVSTSENEEKDVSAEEIIFISTVDIPEVNSELFPTTESPAIYEDIQISEATTESKFQTDFPDVTEIAVTIEEVEKETNEIKRFRSLYNNGTEDESKSENTEDESENTVTKSDSINEDISKETNNPEVKEQTESIETEVLSEIKEQNESEQKSFTTTETPLLSDLPEDKIAEFLISLKKTSTKIPATDVPNIDSTLTTIRLNFENPDDNSSEINVDLTTTEIKEETIGLDEQKTSTTVTSNDAQQSLVKAFNDLVDSNENRESVILIEETSTSQADEIVDLSTSKNDESSSFQTSTPGQTTEQSEVIGHSTESITENYRITENETTVSTSIDKQVENTQELAGEIQ